MSLGVLSVDYHVIPDIGAVLAGGINLVMGSLFAHHLGREEDSEAADFAGKNGNFPGKMVVLSRFKEFIRNIWWFYKRFFREIKENRGFIGI